MDNGQIVRELCVEAAKFSAFQNKPDGDRDVCQLAKDVLRCYGLARASIYSHGQTEYSRVINETREIYLSLFRQSGTRSTGNS